MSKHISPKARRIHESDSLKGSTLKNSLFPELFLSTENDLSQSIKKTLNLKPRKLASIISQSSKDLSRKFGSVSREKQMTVDRLLNSKDYQSMNKSDRDYIHYNSTTLLPKWNTLLLTNCEVVKKINLRKLELLRNSIDTARKDFSDNTNISDITKMTLFDNFYMILKAFNDYCNDLVEQKKEIESIISSLSQENQKLKSELTKTQEKLSQALESNQKLTKKPQPKAKMADASPTKHEIEKAKLLERISLLEDYLNQIKNFSKLEELTKELDRYKGLYETGQLKIEKLKQKIKNMNYRFQLEIGEIKSKASEDSAFVKQFSNMSEEYKRSIEVLERAKNRLETQNLCEVNRYMMLSEDFSRFASYKIKYEKLQEQMKTLKIRFNQLELEVIAGSASRKADTVTWVSLDDPIFEKVRIASLFPSPLTDPIELTKTSEFKLSTVSFAGLLDLEDDQFGFEPQFSNWLEVNIRGIYDSKYYEHLLCTPEAGKTPSRFPDFVFSWIGKFCIDDKTRQVTELEWWKKDSIDTLRIKFLTALKLANTKKVWELYTFEEFLNEELMLDELGFFLHCRNLLFKGPQLSLTHGKFSNFHYVDREVLNELIDSIMYKLTAKERIELKNQLYLKTSPPGSNSIESGFALRLLLEYYVREKKAKFLGLNKTIEVAPKTARGSLTFHAFKSICVNLDQHVQDIFVCKMFKLAWMVGKGKIDCQSFLIAANESNFFYHCLQLRGIIKALPLTVNQDIRDESGTHMQKLAYDTYIKNKQALNMIKEIAKGIGISEILDVFSRYEELLQKKLQEPLEFYNGLDLADSFRHLWLTVIRVQIIYEEMNKKYLYNPIDILGLPKVTEDFTNAIQGLLLNRISTKFAVRKIQKIWKAKAKKAVAVTATVIKSIALFKRKIKK